MSCMEAMDYVLHIDSEVTRCHPLPGASMFSLVALDAGEHAIGPDNGGTK